MQRLLDRLYNAMRQTLLRFLLLALLTIAISTGGLYAWLRTSLPDTSGEIVMSGITAPITISRTLHGAPTIDASTQEDAHFALGFVHAQDRLWQMEGMRRFALGELTEVIGAETLQTDIAQRRIGFGRLATAQYESLDRKTRSALILYADGVNAYLKSRDGSFPMEFSLLGFEPEPWLPEHGLLWGRLMAYQLSARWRDDLAREALIDSVGMDKVRELWPFLKLGEQAAFKDTPLPPRQFESPLGASNAWAIVASRSNTGGALLAGDPHLGLTIPGTWYLARMRFGDQVIEGATAPGVPFVIIGRNANVAWSFTSNEADLQDVVRVANADITSNDPEDIRVKGGNIHSIRIFYSGDAPVIAGGMLDQSGDDGLALMSTTLKTQDKTPAAFYGLNEAQNLSDAIRALDDFQSPLMNVIVADTSGRVARTHAGDIPLRKGIHGRLPMTASDLRWEQVRASSVYPPEIDPVSGAVANANEQTPEMILSEAELSGDWASRARADRLDALLSAQQKFDLDAMAEIQHDVIDVTGEIWKSVIGEAVGDGLVPHAQILMQRWDGTTQRDAPQPLIYASWLSEMNRVMFYDEMDDRFFGMKLPGPRHLLELLRAESPWCDDAKTPDVETCKDLPKRTFDIAVNKLSLVYGDNPSDWRWSSAHEAFFANALLGRLPTVGDFFNRYIQTDGGDRTLNRGASRSGAGVNGLFPHVHGAGFRALHDMAGAPSRYMVAPGQSGNPMSSHYDDLMELWRDGHTITFDDVTLSTMVLLPIK